VLRQRQPLKGSKGISPCLLDWVHSRGVDSKFPKSDSKVPSDRLFAILSGIQIHIGKKHSALIVGSDKTESKPTFQFLGWSPLGMKMLCHPRFPEISLPVSASFYFNHADLPH
jgi:hypothetical protein